MNIMKAFARGVNSRTSFERVKRKKIAILYRNPHHLLVRHIKPFLERHTRMRANVDTKKGAQCVVFKYDKYFFTTDTQTVEKRS